MPRWLFLMLMEQEATKRFMNAHAAVLRHVVGNRYVYPESSHWDQMERLCQQADREETRRKRWLNLRLANAGLATVG